VNLLSQEFGAFPNTVLLNKYHPGAYCPQHSDNEPDLKLLEPIFCLSLGAEAIMKLGVSRFMKQVTSTSNVVIPKLSFPLRAGSLVVMTGAAQLLWTHQIAPLSSDQPYHVRVSLTFRSAKNTAEKSEDSDFIRYRLYDELALYRFQNRFGIGIPPITLRSEELDTMLGQITKQFYQNEPMKP
jgi:hypothetical protein